MPTAKNTHSIQNKTRAAVVFSRDILPMTRDVIEVALGILTRSDKEKVQSVMRSGIGFRDAESAKIFKNELIHLAIKSDQDSYMGAALAIHDAIKVIPIS